MTTVWLLSAGEYDEHQPQGVFASEAAAWESAARMANGDWDAAAKWAREHPNAPSIRLRGVLWLPPDPVKHGRSAMARFLASVEVTQMEVQE